jgi:hypothetical protein
VLEDSKYVAAAGFDNALLEDVAGRRLEENRIEEEEEAKTTSTRPFIVESRRDSSLGGRKEARAILKSKMIDELCRKVL